MVYHPIVQSQLGANACLSFIWFFLEITTFWDMAGTIKRCLKHQLYMSINPFEPFMVIII